MKCFLHKYFPFLPIAFCLLLSACSQQTLKLETNRVDSTVRVLQARIASHPQWDMQVRIALRHDKLSWRGIMQWQQREDSFRMVFTGLWGRRLMLIESQQDGSVSAIDSKGHRRQASDPSVLIESMLGTEVPVDSLHYWLLGAPAPDASYSNPEFDAQGRLQSYQQSEWTINYSDYWEEDCMLWLPSSLTLSHDQTQLWLNIRAWQTPSETIKTSVC